MSGRINSENPLLPEGAKNATLKCKEIGALGINVECTLRGKEWVEYAHELGLITSCWTVDKEEGSCATSANMAIYV